MKTRPFNLEQAIAGKPLVTRDGRRVTGFRKPPHARNDYPLRATVSNIEYSYTDDGAFNQNRGTHSLDLFMLDEESQPDILDGLTPEQAETVRAFAWAVRNGSVEGIEFQFQPEQEWHKKKGGGFNPENNYRIAPAPEPKFKVGDRVKAFDHSTKGTVDQVDDSFALVKWDTGLTSPENQNDLKPLKTVLRPWTPEEAEGRWVKQKGQDNLAYRVGNGFVSPQTLLEHWLQLDGSPCGVEKEVDA